MTEKSNFESLKEHDPLFFQLASAAERAFASDPNTTLIKLRQLGEAALAQDLAARCGIEFDDKTTQADLRFKLNWEIHFDANVAELFHTLRIESNCYRSRISFVYRYDAAENCYCLRKGGFKTEVQHLDY